MTNLPIPTSKSARPSTSRKVTKTAASGKEEAERRAWATVNKETGGGKKSPASGRGKAENPRPLHAKAGAWAARRRLPRSAAERSASAKKAAATRKRNAAAK